MKPDFALRDVLVPTDLSDEADRALEHGRLLSERFGARMTLYHAVEVPDPSFAHWAFAHGHEVWCLAAREAEKALRFRAERLGVPTEVAVERTSSAHRSLVERIKTTRPDLTVMATHARRGLSHLLLGSVTEKVLQQVHRPVLCIRATEHEGTLPYRRILVPTDLSLLSRLPFPLGAALARAFGAEVLGLHVVPVATFATLSGVPETRPTVIPSEAHLWKFFQQDFEGLPVTAQVHSGPVWERIVHVARVEKADLIVMSTRGHDSLADRLLGSNTERVVRHAPCPVLVA
jgi:nucleotide-binding universal stress UspA family protein